jgi:hypothetical protein
MARDDEATGWRVVRGRQAQETRTAFRPRATENMVARKGCGESRKRIPRITLPRPSNVRPLLHPGALSRCGCL